MTTLSTETWGKKMGVRVPEVLGLSTWLSPRGARVPPLGDHPAQRSSPPCPELEAMKLTEWVRMLVSGKERTPIN